MKGNGRNARMLTSGLLLLALMVPAAAWVGRTLLEKVLLIGVGLLVLVVELLNSAIEAAIDVPFLHLADATAVAVQDAGVERVAYDATALPVQIFLWADSPERAFEERTSAAILILIAFLLLMNLAAIILRKKMERK